MVQIIKMSLSIVEVTLSLIFIFFFALGSVWINYVNNKKS